MAVEKMTLQPRGASHGGRCLARGTVGGGWRGRKPRRAVMARCPSGGEL